jgi:hypothetical protein
MVKPSASDGIYRPTKLAAVIDALSEDGVSPEEVLRGVGVGADELRSPDTLISLEQLLAGCKMPFACRAIRRCRFASDR